MPKIPKVTRDNFHFWKFSCVDLFTFGAGLQIFGFQEDAIPSTEAWADLVDPEFPSVPGTISYCFRAKVLYFRTETSIFSYDTEENHNEIRIGDFSTNLLSLSSRHQ